MTPRLSAVEFGVEFLHIVRDPRAAIHGMTELLEKSNNNLDRSMAKDCSDMASRWAGGDGGFGQTFAKEG